MVSLGESQPPPPPSSSCSETHSISSISSSNKIQRSQGRSMRTIRSTIFQKDFSCSFPVSGNNVNSTNVTGISEILTDSVMDFRLAELATAAINNEKSCFETEELLDLSQAFSDFSSCSSDISGELQRLSCIPSPEALKGEAAGALLDQEPWLGFLQKGNLSSEIFDGISPENLEQAVKICLEGLESSSIDIKRSAAAKLTQRA
ncbi:hypothetical protein AQUCO_05000047v1 [Aquilegia coerulea]|uniref:Uncharacterized protein n=1 Tax=Aquilegia coerulea TaxID=218851 RepID=A0A2G5CJM9_AQUCA|nr:hypothetical protein AQUCO_05000047v1 [Aquilegia coerulea]